MNGFLGRADRAGLPASDGDGPALSTRINFHGRLCTQRLTVGDDEITLLSAAGGDGATEAVEGCWRRAEIEAFRVEAAIGSSYLQARLDGRWIDLLRYPNGNSDRVRQFATHLEQWRTTGHWPGAGGGGYGHRPDQAGAVGGRESPGDKCDPPSSKPTSLRPRGMRAKPWQLSRWFRLQAADGAAPSSWQTLRRIASILRPFRGKALLAVVLSVGAVGVELTPPMLQKVLVDQVLDVPHTAEQMPHLLSLLLVVVVGLLLFRVASTIVTIWKGYVSSVVGTSMTAELRNRLVEKLHRLPLAFHDRHQVGSLMSRVAYDTETMHTLLHHLTSGFLLQVLQLGGIGVMLFFLSPKLAAITMLPMPLILLGSWYFTRYLYPKHHRYWEAVGKQAAALTGMLSGIHVVKSFAQEEREWRRFCSSSRRLRDSRQTVDVTTVGFTALMGFIFSLGGLAVWYIGGRDILADRMSLGALMALLAYLAMFYAPLTSLVEAVTWFSSFLSASHRIFSLLESEEEEREPAAARDISTVRGAIRFEDVTFGYYPGQTVLDHVAFDIQPGEIVGIAGRSGSGKSTLVSLIGRLYEVSSGRITIDGVDVRDFGSRALRRNIGMVLQEPFLFLGSVAENIAYGHPDASPEEILAAARNADSHDFIMRLPFGYDTQLGEGGCGLSGGERQRISIARALIFDPPILIFDEATASVDALAEESIMRAVRRVARGRTAIVIAHRLSTIRDADRLLVFDHGRLVEQGTHTSLVGSGGLYSTLVNVQMSAPASAHAEAGAANPWQRNGQGPPHWLDPATTQIDLLPAGRLRVRCAAGEFDNVCASRAFPATSREEFISLQGRDPAGREAEIGMVRALAEWPAEARARIEASLEHRYLLHYVLQVHQVRQRGERLRLVVETDRGPARPEVERTDENIQSYGRRGILFTATDGALYVVPDSAQLPARQRRLLASLMAE